MGKGGTGKKVGVRRRGTGEGVKERKGERRGDGGKGKENGRETR